MSIFAHFNRLHLTRRSFLFGAGATIGATALVITRPAAPPHTYAPLRPTMKYYPRISDRGWNLAGPLISREGGYETTLRFVGDLSAFRAMAAHSLGVDAATADLGTMVFEVSLLMNDMTRYTATPITAPALDLLRAPNPQRHLTFPHVRIADAATLPGTVKHLRYPTQLQLVANARQDSAIVTTVLGTDLEPHPTAIQGSNEHRHVQYWGEHLRPSLHA